MGAPETLGGFAVGLALSRRFFLPFGIVLREDREFSSEVEIEMKPIIHLFTPIFFVMVGLSLSLHEIDWGFPFIRVFSGSIFAELGRVSGILTNEIYAGIIIVVALTTLASPFVLKSLYIRYGEAMLS